MRVYEIARKYKIGTKELIEILKNLGIEGKKVKFIIKGKEKDVEIAKNSLINDYNLITKIRRFLYG
jgi:ribosomal protein L4